MQTKQREAIVRHGQALLRLFPDATERDPLKLCKRLRRLNATAERIALALCNDSTYSNDQADRDSDRVKWALGRMLGKPAAGRVIVNRDPRGHALKIEAPADVLRAAGLSADWGGYGILAPEIGPDGEQTGN